jgi:hypothetical protein
MMAFNAAISRDAPLDGDLIDQLGDEKQSQPAA